MASEQIEIIMTQVQQLSPEDRLKLLNRLKESVNNGDESGVIYSKYRDSGRPESTEEDFRLAEWHPTEEELDGH